MDDIRRGQIALLIVKDRSRREGIRLDPNFRRDIGNRAKAIGVSYKEAMEFVEELVREMVEEMFAKNGGDPTETTMTEL